MENTNYDGWVKLIQESKELVTAVKEAKANDGKIRLFEKIEIAKQLGGVIRAIPDVRDDIKEFMSATQSEMYALANGVLNEMPKLREKITKDDFTDVLLCAQAIVRIIERK